MQKKISNNYVKLLPGATNGFQKLALQESCQLFCKTIARRRIAPKNSAILSID